MDQNSIHEESKSRLKTGNACYHLEKNLLSISLPYKNVKIKICITILLPILLYECETLWLMLHEECWLRVFKTRVLKSIFGPGRDKVPAGWRRLYNGEL
jgi:hypothetical protein